MSIAIDITQVKAVLLADGWHDVAGSFDLDSYEFLWSGMDNVTLRGLDEQNRTRDPRIEPWRDPMIVHSGGNSGVCATGFMFSTPEGDVMAGPLTAILAVRFTRDDDEDDET